MAEAVGLKEPATGDAEAFRIFYLSDLLRRARARVRPPEWAARADGCGGLTQEQAAELLNTSDRHYRNLERGRLTHPDPQFLDEVAHVLGMGATERELLYRLAAGRPPPPRPLERADIRQLQFMVDGLGDIPALVTDAAWNVLVWNKAETEALEDPGTVPEPWRNSILWRFTPTGMARFSGNEPGLHALVGRVRAAYVADGGYNPALRTLVERLLLIPSAAEHWHAGALAREPMYELRTLMHPSYGARRVQVLRTRIEQGDLRITQFIPAPEQ